MTAARASLPMPVPAYRALMLFDRLPEGCRAHPVADTAFSPHQRPGEWAVIDTADTEPVNGEIFLVRINHPLAPDGHVLRFVQLWGRTMVLGRETETGLVSEEAIAWMLHFQIRQHFGPMTREQVLAALRGGSMGLCDGPLRTEGVRRRIVGRVVGLLVPPVAEPARSLAASRARRGASKLRRARTPRRG